MSVILIHGTQPRCRECFDLLEGEGHDVVECPDREALLDALATRRPDVLVYVLGDLSLDLGFLSLFRHFAPRLPIILLGGFAELTARRSVQEIRPTYYGVFPLEPRELCDAVRGALSNRGASTRTSERPEPAAESLRRSGTSVRERKAAASHRVRHRLHRPDAGGGRPNGRPWEPEP
jgi:DNA-binding response OmpR family regulator